MDACTDTGGLTRLGGGAGGGVVNNNTPRRRCPPPFIARRPRTEEPFPMVCFVSCFVFFS